MRDPTETLEELYSLLLISGHVLADEGQGETPLVKIFLLLLYTAFWHLHFMFLFINLFLIAAELLMHSYYTSLTIVLLLSSAVISCHLYLCKQLLLIYFT